MKKPVVFALGLGLGGILGVVAGLAFVAYSAKQTPRQTSFSNVFLACAPFDGDWLISWGGENPEDNHQASRERQVSLKKHQLEG